MEYSKLESPPPSSKNLLSLLSSLTWFPPNILFHLTLSIGIFIILSHSRHFNDPNQYWRSWKEHADSQDGVKEQEEDDEEGENGYGNDCDYYGTSNRKTCTTIICGTRGILSFPSLFFILRKMQKFGLWAGLL